ncbi:hypothetical protein ACLMJK_001299 [Lecanora helva]
MATPLEGPNPLRPYYVPPSVSSSRSIGQNGTHAAGLGSRQPSASTNSSGSSARNILADMDYSDYISDSSPSIRTMTKGLVEQAIWKYTSVFLAQPFDVAKIVLQVQMAGSKKQSSVKSGLEEDMRKRPGKYRHDRYESYDVRLTKTQLPSDDSDLDSPSYFTPSAPVAHTPTKSSRRRRGRSPPQSDGVPRVRTPQSPPSKTSSSPHVLDLKSPSSVLAAISSIWAAEGSWGIWKGTNSTYVHSILLSTITSFVRSFFSAFLALPDPGLFFTSTPTFPYAGGIDVLSSPSPFASLTVAVSAAGIAGVILAPIDIARTKLILTPSTHLPRSIIATLKSLPSWTLPFSIAPTTVLHSTLPTLISASTPLFFRSKMGIDPLITPNLYAIATFGGQVLELGIKLPIETVLRRGQIEVAKSVRRGEDLPTVVECGPYKGLFGTMHSIIYEEGETGGPAELVKGTTGAPAMKASKVGQDRKKRKGQGFEGLWRGWRVGMWGLIGVWGAATLGGAGGKGGEF